MDERFDRSRDFLKGIKVAKINHNARMWALRRDSVRFHKLVLSTIFVVAYWSLFSQTLSAGSTNPWKYEIMFPDEPFEQRHYSDLTNMGWIKFTIPEEADALGPVTYQDSHTYELHYEFVTAHLDPFIGISPEEFERVSLYEQEQQLILGAVVTPPKEHSLTPTIQEVGIQFVRSDPYAREEIVRLFEIVKSTIIADPDVTFYYFPTFEQSNVAHDHEEWFAKQGIPISSPDRWLKGNVIYV